MAKRYNEPVLVRISPARRPEAFIWRGRCYQIEDVVKRWTVSGEWWQKQAQRLHAVVAASRSGTSGQYELVYEVDKRQWYLRRIYD